MTKIINDNHEDNKNQLFFSIPSGTVSGDFVSRKQMETEGSDTNIQVLFKGINQDNIDFTQSLVLKNVTIMHNNGKDIKLPFYILFIDQISGISLGNFN